MKRKHDERADDVQMLQAGVNNVILTKETKMNEVILMAILSLLPLHYRRGKLHYNWRYSSLEDQYNTHCRLVLSTVTCKGLSQRKLEQLVYFHWEQFTSSELSR